MKLFKKAHEKYEKYMKKHLTIIEKNYFRMLVKEIKKQKESSKND